MLPEYKVINMEEYPRKAQYELFSKYADPYTGITAQVDITKFYDSTKKKSYPFFISALYCVTKALNSVPEMRQRVLDGKIVEFTFSQPSYVLGKDDGTYCFCPTEFCSDPDAFIKKCRNNEKEALKRVGRELEDPDDVLSRFFVSATPWISFTHCHQPTPNPADYNPRIVLGKYMNVGAEKKMPVAVLVNHALAEGIHMARFFDAFQRELDNF